MGTLDHIRFLQEPLKLQRKTSKGWTTVKTVKSEGFKVVTPKATYRFYFDAPQYLNSSASKSFKK